MSAMSALHAELAEAGQLPQPDPSREDMEEVLTFSDLIRLPLPEPNSCISEDAGTRDRVKLLFRCIPLTKGYFALVDAQDYEWATQWRWAAHVDKHGYVYATRKNRGKLAYLHREIIFGRICEPVPRSQMVDHRNRQSLDNRRCNLRSCTHAENLRNRRAPRMGTSAYLGVHWSKRECRWRARICVDGRSISLGYFRDETEAATAYDQAARRYFGEFSSPNFTCCPMPVENRLLGSVYSECGLPQSGSTTLAPGLPDMPPAQAECRHRPTEAPAYASISRPRRSADFQPLSQQGADLCASPRAFLLPVLVGAPGRRMVPAVLTMEVISHAD